MTSNIGVSAGVDQEFSSAATHTGDVHNHRCHLLYLRSAFSDLIISRVPRNQGLFEKVHSLSLGWMRKKKCVNDKTSAPKINSLHVDYSVDGGVVSVTKAGFCTKQGNRSPAISLQSEGARYSQCISIMLGSSVSLWAVPGLERVLNHKIVFRSR